MGNFTGKPGPRRPHPDFTPIGHVGLVSDVAAIRTGPATSTDLHGRTQDWVDQENGMSEPDLGDRSRGLVIFSSFFIVLSQQGGGLGNAVIDEIEARAPALGAKAITLARPTAFKVLGSR